MKPNVTNTPRISDEEIRHLNDVKLNNRIAFISIGAAVAYAVLFAILGYYNLVLLTLIFVLGFGLAPVLNKYGKHYAARLSLTIFITGSITIYPYYLPYSEIRLFYLFSAVVSFLIFKPDETKEKAIFFLISLLGFLFYQSNLIDFPNLVPIEDQEMLKFMGLPVLFLILFLSLSKMNSQTINFLSSLRKEADEKGELAEKLQSNLEELVKMEELSVRQRNEKEIAIKEAQFKDTFLSNMSHEIRTPLNGIIGMLDIMKETQLNEKQLDYVEIMKSSSDTLLNIINDVLDLSKLQAGKMELKPTEFDIHQLIHSSKSLYQSMSDEKNIALISKYEKDVPNNIIADKTKISQVLNNLVSNALKFSEKGNITIHCSLKNDLFQIAVSDEGRGIETKDLDRLFNKFSQLEDSNQGLKGTGLGLTLCKEISEFMGGEIKVSSEVGKGSTFIFSFKYEKGKDETTKVIKEVKKLQNINLNVLLVEDMVVNQKVAGLMLKSLGSTSIVANNGQEAIDLFEEGKFDLILMDIRMPVMDGLTATKEIRKRFKNIPPIVGLSANAMEGDAEKYIEEGFDDYIAKPVTKEVIEQKISQLLDKNTSK